MSSCKSLWIKPISLALFTVLDEAPTPLGGNVSAPGARRESFVTLALPVDCCC